MRRWRESPGARRSALYRRFPTGWLHRFAGITMVHFTGPGQLGHALSLALDGLRPRLS